MPGILRVHQTDASERQRKCMGGRVGSRLSSRPPKGKPLFLPVVPGFSGERQKVVTTSNEVTGPLLSPSVDKASLQFSIMLC